MTFEHRTGDIFAQTDIEGRGHGVNCKGKMGSGIAVAFKHRYPEMHDEYVRHCKEGTLQLGMVFPWWDERHQEWVFNMASQYHTGRDARMDALLTTMDKVLAFCVEKNIARIGLPQIGCGIGGLRWDEVSKELEAKAEASSVHVVLVTYDS